MSKLDTLEQIVDEIEVGLEKLDVGDYWTTNSHPLSLLSVSILLFIIGVGGIPIKLYYTLKAKVYWRLKFRRLYR